MAISIDPAIIAAVEADIWRRGGKRQGSSKDICFRCPIEGHADHKPSARWNPIKHMWFCDVCERDGGALDLAKRFGIDVGSFFNGEQFLIHSSPRWLDKSHCIHYNLIVSYALGRQLKMISAEGRLRKETEARLGRDIPDNFWDYLEEIGKVDDAINVYGDVLGVDHILPDLEKLLDLPPSFGRQQASQMLHPRQELSNRAVDCRQDAISVLLAIEAAKEPQVVAFRSKALLGKLLPWEEVEGWVKQQAEKDGPLTRWVSVPLPPGRDVRFPQGSPQGFPYPDPPFEVGESHPVHGLSSRSLAYSAPGDKWMRRVYVAAEGTLDQLKTASQWLANRYGWHESQASVFVLTGITPLITLMVIAPHLKGSYSATSRITLTVDPALSPKRVAEAYRNIRDKMLGQRHRSLSQKHTQLALFAAERPEDETWKEWMKLWNRKYPKWKYDQESNFGRDAEKARERLLHPDYTPALPD